MLWFLSPRPAKEIYFHMSLLCHGADAVQQGRSSCHALSRRVS
jgi:hypothetical protein